jgi:hypothetical protein
MNAGDKARQKRGSQLMADGLLAVWKRLFAALADTALDEKSLETSNRKKNPIRVIGAETDDVRR